MGLWDLIRLKGSIRSELKAGARKELAQQQNLSRIERDYRTNIKMQMAAQTKIAQIDHDEAQGQTYTGVHKLKTKYQAVADDLSQEKTRKFGNLLPQVETNVNKMSAFLKSREEDLTLDRFLQGYQNNRTSVGFRPEDLLRRGVKHPAGFDNLKAIWNRCIEIETEAAGGNLTEESRGYFKEAILKLTEAGLGGHIPQAYLNPLEEGSEKTGMDFLLDSGRIGLLCGALRNAVLAGMYEKVKNRKTSDLQVDVFSKLLLEKQVSSAITHRVTISAAYQDAVKEYLHPKEKKPEKVEIAKEPEKVEIVKEAEPEKVEIAKEPEIDYTEPKTKVEAALKRKADVIPEIKKWLEELDLKKMIPEDISGEQIYALNFYDRIRYKYENKQIGDLEDYELKRLGEQSKWFTMELQNRARVIYLQEQHPEIFQWVMQESLISSVLSAFRKGCMEDSERKIKFEKYVDKLIDLQRLVCYLRMPLDEEYEKNQKEYEEKAALWYKKRRDEEAKRIALVKEEKRLKEERDKEREKEKQEHIRKRTEDINQQMLNCEEVLRKQGEKSLKEHTMERLWQSAGSICLGVKTRGGKEQLASIISTAGEMTDWNSPLKMILMNPQSGKYMVNHHPYVTKKIERYLQLRRFQEEYSRLEKEGKLAFVNISKESLRLISEELKESEKLISFYEKADWMKAAKIELAKGSKKMDFLLPEENVKKDEISEPENEKQRTEEQMEDEKQADSYAKKEQEAKIQVIKEAYPGTKKFDEMLIYHRLEALLGGSLHSPQNTEDYSLFEELKDKNFTYTPEAMAKMVKIRDLDRFLGILRKPGDYYVKTRESMDQGKPLLVIEDVIAKKPSEFMQDQYLKAAWNPSYHMDRDFATKLSNLHARDLHLLLEDVLDEEQSRKLSSRLETIQATLKQEETELIGKEDYEDEGRLATIIASYHTTISVNAKNAGSSKATGQSISEEYYKKKKDYPAIKGNSNLKMWLMGAKEQKNPSQYLSETMEAVGAYYDEVDKKWGSKEYYQAHRKMMEAFRKWKSSKESEASKAFQKLSEIFADMYGKKFIQKSEDTKEMANARDACKLQDEMNLRYAKYQYQNTLRESEKKGKKEGYKENHPEPKLLDRSGEALFPHEPCAEDIKQGELGDCYFLSCLLAVVRNDPQQILDRMEDLGDLVKVTFEKQTVYVSKKICTPYCANDVLWVQIMEKAYAMLQEPDDANECIGDDYNEFADELLKDFGFDSLEADEKDAKLKDLFAHTTLHLGSGGYSQRTYKELFKEDAEYKYAKVSKPLRVYEERGNEDRSKTQKAYEELWDLVVDGEVKKSEQVENKGKWKGLKELLRQQLKDKLMAELEYRLGTVETLTNQKKHKTAYRALTVDDFCEALRDVKNWKNQKGRSVFYDLLVAMQKKFPKISEEKLKEYLNQLGDDFMNAGMHTKSTTSFQYSCRMEPNATIRYTNQALEQYGEIKKFLDDKQKGQVVFAGTPMFVGYESGGGLHDLGELDGMSMGHAYIVTGYKEDKGHKFITMRNPWGTGEVFYAERTRRDQSKYIIGKKHLDEEIGGGEFDLELNDFMNKIEVVYCMN